MNGDVFGIGLTSVRIVGNRIAAIGADPAPGDFVVRLNGSRVLPGLINSHDHLQLNNFPRLKFRDEYSNASEWIEDIQARRATDDDLIACKAVSRTARLWLGGLKNLLSGVTTVIHHDPLYPALSDERFPVRVLTEFGWSHSIAVDGNDVVQQSFHSTPGENLWFIHAGEGVDQIAARELETLDSLQCIAENSRIIHGVAFDQASLRRIVQAGAGLVWCPGSNLFLFGRTVDIADLVPQKRIALGSDSRLTGERDLLAELRRVFELALLPTETLESIVTTDAAELMRLKDRGVVAVDRLADLLIIPGGVRLWELSRRDIRCVMLGGRMRFGDLELAEQLMPAGERVPFYLDNREKALDATIARVLRGSEVLEPGTQWTGIAGAAA